MQAHLAHMTKYTREQMQGKTDPERDMRNRKPYRTKELKKEAKDNAVLVRAGTLLGKSFPRHIGTYISRTRSRIHD